MALVYAVEHGNKPKYFRRRLRLTDLTDDEVFQATRMSRDGVQHWCGLLDNDLRHPTERVGALPVDTQLLTALQFYASGSFQWMLGNSTGPSQPTISRIVHRVTGAICRYGPAYISFPTRQDELLGLKRKFSQFGGFPNVVGAIGEKNTFKM